jgi:predicted dehydrogenase
MSKKLKWGIIGLGNIAHAFVQDLQLVNREEIVATASRSIDRAKSFAQQYNIAEYYGSYQELFDQADVDIVYIATPHNSHAELSIAAMRAGKHVLCEKPLAVNRLEVQRMIAVAKEEKVFLMEAFWSRFNPSIEEALTRIENGDLGEVNYVNADFTFYRDDPDDSRMLSAELAGGSLLDMGVYPVFLSYVVLGKPEEIHAIGRHHTTGADLQTAAIFKYEHAVANMMSGFKSQSDMRARICGTKGSIFIDPIWHETQSYEFLDNRTGNIEKHLLPTKGKGFTYEIEECTDCILQGRLESKKWSLQDSLNLIMITDEIRKQTNLIYPFEKYNNER